MIKASDYVVNFLKQHKIDTLFTLTGGFAMHLNDSFGKNEHFNIYYQHHEQSCGYSATGYTKTNSKPCIVCTTAGVAATNTISPCLIAYQDSLPIFFISGQSKSKETTRFMGNEISEMKLRHYAGQDCDIIEMVKPITKYAYEVTNEFELPEILEEAYKQMINGRPGPVWVSIPLDIQGKYMKEIEPKIIEKTDISNNSDIDIDINIKNVYELLSNSTRPIIIAGNGIKMGCCVDKFKNFLDCYKIPVVVSFHGTDLIENSNSLYVGKTGLIGDRAGNFAVQNSDLIISFGCRMSQGVVGYNSNTYARSAKIVYIDNDENELKKQNVNYTLKINMDLNTFFDNFNNKLPDFSSWINKCNHWKNKWQFELPIISEITKINPYFALKKFFEIAPPNKNIICSSGSIVTNIWHMVNIKQHDKFIISSQGDMGFELTAAIGSYVANKSNLVIPILGEGSFQFNIQELQTIVHYKMPIKILIMNNNSYGANVITQSIYFKHKYGSDNESDLSFPKTENIACAYGIDYVSIINSDELNDKFNIFLNSPNAVICEVFCSVQTRVPKISAVKNDDGTFSSRPFEDMEPFLDRDEFKNEMIVDII